MAKAILNYTTSIEVWKTISEIQQILVAHKVTNINIQTKDSQPTALIFVIEYRGVPLNYSLPCNYQGVLARLQRGKNIASKYKTEEQALRVGWRIVKDWVEAQLAMVEAEVVQMHEVFMPYLLIPKTGKTLFETFETGGFSALEAGK